MTPINMASHNDPASDHAVDSIIHESVPDTATDRQVSDDIVDAASRVLGDIPQALVLAG